MLPLHSYLPVRSKMAESCVAVYCGASPGKRPAYEQAAVGETISMYKSVIAIKLILNTIAPAI